MARTLILNARQYRMTDDRTGELREGTSLHYILPGVEVQGDGARGPDIIKTSAPYDLYEDLEVIPGIYDVDFEPGRVVTDRNGGRNISMVPVRAEYADEVDLGLYDRSQTGAS